MVVNYLGLGNKWYVNRILEEKVIEWVIIVQRIIDRRGSQVQ